MVGDEATGVMPARALDDAAHARNALGRRHATSRLGRRPSRVKRENTNVTRREIHRERLHDHVEAGLAGTVSIGPARIVERDRTQSARYERHDFQFAAADLLDEPGRSERLPALGFFACGPVYYGDAKKFDQIDDRIDTLIGVGRTAAAQAVLQAGDPVAKREAWMALAECWIRPAVELVPAVDGVGSVEITVLNGEEFSYARSLSAPILDLRYLTTRAA